MSSLETGQMSAVETGQITAAETSVLSQQKKAQVQSCLTKVPVPSQNIKFGSKWVENRRFGLKSGPNGSGQPSGFIWTKFQAKPSILDPFRTKFDVFGPDRKFGWLEFGFGLALDKPHYC